MREFDERVNVPGFHYLSSQGCTHGTVISYVIGTNCHGFFSFDYFFFFFFDRGRRIGRKKKILEGQIKALSLSVKIVPSSLFHVEIFEIASYNNKATPGKGKLFYIS